MNKIMYSIYHIPGIKIGCSKRVDKRIKEQGYTNFEILEEHLDIDLASKREKELQKQYGYDVDTKSKSYSDKFSLMGIVGSKKSKVTQKSKNIGIYTKDINLRKEWQKLGSDVVKQKYGKQHYSDMGKKSHINGHKGAEASCKKVIGFDKKGNKTEYNSISDVARKFNITHAAISNNLRGLTKFTKGYRFEYA